MIYSFLQFINKNPELQLSQFLKKKKIPLTEIKQGPGLYIIFCKPKQKVYIGQSINICRRLGHHWHTLNNHCHDCTQLQTDWNRFGSDEFFFYCLCVGVKWKDEQIRKKLENDLLTDNSTFFYNVGVIKKNKDYYKKAFKYKDCLYTSIRQASNHLEISETTIRRKLKDSNEKDWKYVSSLEYTPKLVNSERANPVSVHGIYYRSERYVSIQTGISRRTLKRHLESDKHDYCYYAENKIKLK